MERVVSGNSGWAFKQREADPHDSLTQNVRRILRKIPVVGENGGARNKSDVFTLVDDDDVDVPGFKNISDNQGVIALKVETKPAQTKQLDQKEILRRQRFMSFNTDFRNQADLESFENIPAYARMGMNIANDDKELSRYSVDKESGLREENSFLHDNVD